MKKIALDPKSKGQRAPDYGVRKRDPAKKKKSPISDHLKGKDKRDSISQFEDYFKGEYDNQTKKLIETYTTIIKDAEKSGKHTPKEMEILKKQFKLIIEELKDAEEENGTIEDQAAKLTRDIEKAELAFKKMKHDYDNLPLLETGLTYEKVNEARDLVDNKKDRLKLLKTKMKQNLVTVKEDIKDFVKSEEAVTKVTQKSEVKEHEVSGKGIVDAALSVKKKSLAAYEDVLKYVPNDESIEEQLAEIQAGFLGINSAVMKASEGYRRQATAYSAVISLASFLSTPGVALGIAMKANDDQPKTADWRDVLDKAKGFVGIKTKPKDVKRAEADIDTFTSAMKAMEPTYKAILVDLPDTGPGVVVLRSAIGDFGHYMKLLVTMSSKVVEEYPALTVVLAGIADVGMRQQKLFLKELG